MPFPGKTLGVGYIGEGVDYFLSLHACTGYYSMSINSVCYDFIERLIAYMIRQVFLEFRYSYKNFDVNFMEMTYE